MLDLSFQMSGGAGRLGRTIASALLVFIALSVFSTQAMAVTYSNTTSGVLDGNCLTWTFAVTETDPIGDVNLGLLLDHGRRGQIQATLTNPAGTSRSV
jgi:subtilisin-like proprotein convertase family protein